MARSTARGELVEPRAPSSFELTFPAGLIVVACAGAYWNSLGGPFVWDDLKAIVDNESIRHLWPIADPLWPPRGTPTAGWPLVNLSFALNYAMGGTEVAGYHLVNIAIHLLSALVLFGIVRRTLRYQVGRVQSACGLREARSGRAHASGGGAPRTGRKDPPYLAPLWSDDVLALAAALVWMVHPLQSEVVNYISARSESLAGLFFFLTLYCAVRARGSSRRGWWEVASVGSCALGTASSPLMMTAPLVVLLYDGVYEFPSVGAAIRARKILYAALAATWLELGALLWLAGWPAIGPVTVISSWTNVLNQVRLIAHYVWLAVWPQALVLDYGPPQALSLRQVWPEATLLLALAAATVVALRRWPRAGVLGVMFFLTLAPGSILAPALAEVGAERRTYVPLAALTVLVVMIGCVVTERLAARVPHRSKSIASVAIDVVFVIVLASAVRTVYRSEQYADPVALWSRTVAERPHGRARHALATSLIASGAEDEGIAELRLAAPDVPAAKYALGNELYVIGRMEEAARVLQEFIDAQPADADRVAAQLLRARALVAQGLLEDAAAEFEAVLRAAPTNEEARQGLSEAQSGLAAALRASRPGRR